MPIFEYQNLWYAYIAALAVLGICGFFILKPIPFRWIKWNLLVAVIVFLGAPLQMSEHWMTPSSIYFLFEYFFVGNTEAIQVLHQLLMHVAIAVISTSCIIFGLHLMKSSPEED